ncbi:MAG TPA: AI-2E family transporter [Candidatus Paceibacterota bacterium]|nr:AI-2E family transporter [Candidatus Paceibacterota bacterium]
MEDRHFSISITTGTVTKTILSLLLVGFIYALRSIVLDVLTAIVIASAIEPGIGFLRKRKIPRTIAVILLYLFLLSVFFVIFYFFLPSLFGDIANFINALPGYIQTLNATGALDQYTNLLGLPALSTVSSASIVTNIHAALNIGVVNDGFSTATRIFGGLFSFILIVIFSFYFAVLETGVDDFLRIIVPKTHHEYILGLWRRSQHKIGLWMQGQLLLALIMGVLVFLGLTILGVPDALVLATIAGCFEIIPVFGPTLSAVPAVAVAFGSGGISLGILTIALYVIAQQFENYLIYPLVVTRVVGVPPLLVILALIVGGEFAGFLGIILSVPIAATIQEFVRDLERGHVPSRYKS